MFDILYNY